MPTSKSTILTLGLTLLLSVNAPSNPPDWWAGSGVTNTNPASNKSPANIGQAKHMAKSALDALRIEHPAIADLIEADLVGPGKIISSWNGPTTDEESEKQHAVLLIGQLKALAHPFYQHLKSFDPSWLENQRIYYGTNQAGSIFPWTSETKLALPPSNHPPRRLSRRHPHRALPKGVSARDDAKGNQANTSSQTRQK